ncbi:MAG: DUF6364 family protein [Candidatus Woesearchaeota archaeon]
MKKRITITIEEELFERFRSYCSQNAMKVSSKIEKLIEEFLNSENNESSVK